MIATAMSSKYKSHVLPKPIVKKPVGACDPSRKWSFSNSKPVVLVKSDNAAYENVKYREEKLQDSTDATKLKIVIDNFDKILQEFGPHQAKTKIPKLQKAKTCSIIESKCILKKSVLSDANNISNYNHFTKKKLEAKSKSFHNINDACTRQEPKNEVGPQTNEVGCQKAKVKEVVEKLNSLSISGNIMKHMSLSMCDVSGFKRATSRIPVKTNLASTKSFPSTPSGLNHSDCTSSGSAFGNLSKSSNSNRLTKSVQNLAVPQLRVAKETVKASHSVKNAVEKLEQTCKAKPPLKYTIIKPVVAKPPLKRSSPLASKAAQCKDDRSEPEVKLNLKIAQDFVERIGSVSSGKKYYLDPQDFVTPPAIIAQERQDNCDSFHSSDNNRVVSGKVQKDYRYGSCDKLNIYHSDSDDSGNISNEIELDCEYDITSGHNAKIFFRNGVLSQLESQRDERLAGMVVNLQAHCRGYLARRKLAQRKLQDLAVRCIQRNVRKFLLVRDWPWWRLLVRVTPLLNVHRTEEELRLKTEELEALKSKLEKVESDRTNLKHVNDKLEAKLSEMTADLAEEHSTSTLATERLDAEASERIRLERELSEVQHKNKELQQSSERLEMELIYAKSDLNGISEEDEEGEADGGVYKQRYERAVRELEFTKRRLQQQHEDDLEQLVGLKKQLEKKLTDAYEEVEEQRQVVGQWKRKVQKLNGEMNDLRLLLEEQSSRNTLLEKKQRKFDSETQLLQDELKKERYARDRLSREKEIIVAEKFALESNLADTRLELDLKEERLSSLQREFDEVTCGGKTEEEVTVLRKQKIDCERRLHDQEEELDELAGQVQLLEQSKLRLEMTLESMRKEAKKEAQLRDDEIEEVRCNAQKKVKALEQQLENEHEERTLLLRERHEIERRLAAAAELERNDRAGDEALVHRLKRDLKRTKVLLKDTQGQLERQKADNPSKNMIRQLKNQLEDLECARALAIKTKQSLESDLTETQASLEEANKQKHESEQKANHLLREKSDLQAQLEENEEELAEVLKRYKAAVQQMSLDQLTLQEQVSLVSELEVERNQLKEQLAELTAKLESVESLGDASSNLLVKRTELKVKELESKLELEQTTRGRLEVQITRLKETLDKLQNEMSTSRIKEQQSQEQGRKLQRNIRELKEEFNNSLAKESEAIQKRKDLEKKCEALEAEAATARADLKLAMKRIEDLQTAIQGELENSTSDNSDSDQESYSSDESMSTFLSSHQQDNSSSTTRSGPRKSESRLSSTSSTLGKDSSYA